MLRSTLAVLAIGMTLPSGAQAPAPLASPGGEAAIEGMWLSEQEEAAIEISACDDGVCGTIAWLREPFDGDVAKHDINNPDPTMRSQPIIGLRLLYGFREDGANRWTGGRIYDPSNGKSYRCKMELERAGDVLRIRGYVLTPLLGRTTRWSRTNRAQLNSMSAAGSGQSP